MPRLISGQNSISIDQIRQLNPGLSQADLETKLAKNGLDELYFSYQGQTYLAVGEKIDFQALKGSASAQLDLNGQTLNVKLLGQQNEFNSWGEGWAQGVSLGDSLKKAWTASFTSPQWGEVMRQSTFVGHMGPADALPATQTPAEPRPIQTPSVPADSVSVEPPPTPPAAIPEIQAFFTQVHSGKIEDAQASSENPDKKLVQLIDSATQTLDIAAFELDSDQIAEAVLRAKAKNVKVRIVTDSNYLQEAPLQKLIAAGVPVVDDQRNGLMHNKFVVVDAGTEAAQVWTGSTNLTDNGFWKNNNNAVLIHSKELAENFKTEFEEMFVEHKFGVTSPNYVPHPTVTVGHTRIETYFAAEGKVAGKVAEALNKAEHSIHFMAFSFTHDAVGNVVAQKFNKKVEVRGVFENTGAGTQYSEYGKLKALGADVKKDGNPAVMHHKVFIIDGKTVVTGSFNFSDSADKNNDENLLIIESPELAQQYEEEFKRVYQRGH
ncbi:hypothetical protein COW36_04700 [bacterium (Candidatus Blackallbacteria) CG17_big_fil_post_rev_8_21_14_2_50_48_46]|uniref:phospholipase D n=1 Tax=bacterium (Candidatus Blackallbacteria) CG17_big_fil_post_rev_8_21_14_2_50_48_46 TaxID=2014261 RepID=A0A2M7G9P9_9BACT|nr:MAG: hypothetical protein COW64_04245 [bacterium (Candidatus Blackallbacteria) CG18_big_fil_WC_8_21_14_2_50_49_26]PIW18594.1 MAG: hypothetical protein COW36_04700 [bacterium (Candidatus Blackallbacteria) CG17_big_fil_post_rev_8_21_14_2_50_48_46]PIW46420.1 MAG: hypothetical protein COW20_15980 [bacterium (Candidatus Blackallbacteria) CG13_big_fil_rev_8_21_14_2_50_49_14]